MVGGIPGFGSSVAISADGTVLAVGAPGEDSDPTQPDSMSDNSLPDAGAVYLFQRMDQSWSWWATVKAPNADSGDRFGAAIALNNDGTVLAVGAPHEDSGATEINGDADDNSWPDAGAAYVYRFAGGYWAQQSYLKAFVRGPTPLDSPDHRGERFGYKLAFDFAGSRLIVGEPGHSGCGDGDFDCVQAGAAYIFDTSGEEWVASAYLGPGFDSYAIFGHAVALSADGSRTAISSPGIYRDFLDNPGAVFVFDLRDGIWEEEVVLPPEDPDGFRVGVSGDTIALSADGNTLAISFHNYSSHESRVFGRVWMYSYEGSGWNDDEPFPDTHVGPPKPINEFVDEFARALAISADGRILAVGTPGERSSTFGINGEEADESLSRSGAVYVYLLEDGEWIRKAFIKATNTAAEDLFGKSVALTQDGGTLAVGASVEDSNATGVAGDDGDNSAENSGAVYVY